jgi:hypothetical protein
MTLMARAGETITCEAGHLIGTFTGDVEEGMAYLGLINWKIAEPPALDDELPLRCECGAPWCKAVGEYLVMRIAGEWRPNVPIFWCPANPPLSCCP